MIVITGSDQMCEAIPAAARRPWSPKRACASHAKSTITFAGVERHVCQMHMDVLKRIVDGHDSQAMLAIGKNWGWL